MTKKTKNLTFRLEFLCTDRGQTEPQAYFVQQQIPAKFHPDRSTFGENGGRKIYFISGSTVMRVVWAWPSTIIIRTFRHASLAYDSNELKMADSDDELLATFLFDCS